MHKSLIQMAFLAACVLAVSSAASAEILRVADYNIASSGGAPRSGLDTILQGIGNESVGGIAEPIDLLGIQEVQSQATTTQNVTALLNGIYGANVYSRGSLDGASSGSGTQGIIFNQQKLQLLNQTAIGTVSTSGPARQTMRYEFHVIGAVSSGDFYVYDSHWKASDTTTDEQRRVAEAQAIRADADGLGAGAQVIYMGDYNLYRSTGSGGYSAWNTITAPGAAKANDPLNRVGTWHDNASVVDILTQAPAVNPSDGSLTGGGLDDRFDFQLVSDGLLAAGGLDYISGSYHSLGNNGSVALNGNINDPSNTALSGLANGTQILNLLTTVSDHLPVVADYCVATTAAPEPTTLTLMAGTMFVILCRRRRRR